MFLRVEVPARVRVKKDGKASKSKLAPLKSKLAPL
jgi:hypothetical protein